MTTQNNSSIYEACKKTVQVHTFRIFPPRSHAEVRVKLDAEGQKEGNSAQNVIPRDFFQGENGWCTA